MVWLVDNPNYPMPEKIRKVPYNTLDSIYELSTAQVIITNEMTRMLFEKKKNQYVIMTWHGAWGLKYINLDMGERVTPALIEAINASNAVTDLMIADSDENFAEIRRSFDWKGEVIKCGMPRQDLFFKNNRDIKDRVKKSLGIPTDRNDIKILLYVPTFRDVKPQPVQAYQMDFQKLLRVLAEKFGGQWGALMRLHPILSTSGLSSQIFKPAPNILDVTAYPDVQELLLIADIVLTDYSSAIYDVMLQSKPALIWAKDVEWYEKARGLKPHFYELPYKVNRTEDELFDYIKNLDINKLKKDVKKYCAKIAPYDKGDAAKKVVNKICNVMKIK
ncbi:MAG: CDP-glycerol glycerophosphotransferase family protein [Selenomonadaceae bacterium]|nr:CDP-glycerol glycerophosphotransferase family protein [Selenomonadaceae bacterium]